MKFQTLTIHNIASIEDATIQFDAQPLADSEVFLITGKTGAGKSTILDAICLALYGNTPRMSSSLMQGGTQDGNETVTLKDVRQMMRRNTGEAFVSLTFIGSNGVHYEATWSVARARKKVSGNIQSKKRLLTNLDTGTTLTKDIDIAPEIKVAIGLDFNQFCRTTMLAQGEFTRFLNSKDEEKAEILEKITGVDIYSKIGAKVFAITGEKKDIYTIAQQKMKGTHTLKDEEIEQKNEALRTIEREQRELKKTEETLVAKRDWMKTEETLRAGKVEANEALSKAKEEKESEAFKEKETLVKEWNETREARGWTADMRKAEKMEEEQTRALNRLSADFTEVIGGQEQEVKATKLLAEECGRLDAAIQAEAERAEIYENAQTIEGCLNTIAESRKVIEQSERNIQKENAALTDKLLPAYEKAKQEAEAAKGNMDAMEKELKGQEDAVLNLRLPQLREESGQKGELLNRIATAKDRLESLAQAQEKHKKDGEEIARHHKSIEGKKAMAAQMEKPLSEAKVKMEYSKELLDKQSATIDDFAKTLRARLQVGDTCPVCRQKINSAMPKDGELSQLVDGLRDAYQKAQDEYKNMEERHINLNATINAETSAYEKAKRAFDNDQSVALASAKAHEACAACGICTLDSTTLSSLDDLAQKTRKEKELLDAKIKDGENIEKGVKELRKVLDKERKLLEAKNEDVRKADKDVNDCKNRIGTSTEIIKGKQADIESAKAKVSPYLTKSRWTANWNDSPKESAAAIIMAAKRYEDDVKKKQRLDSKIEFAQTYINNVNAVVKDILSVMPGWKAIVLCNNEKNLPVSDNYARERIVINNTSASFSTNNDQNTDNLLTKANRISTGVAEAMAKLRNAQETIANLKKNLDAFLSAQPSITIDRLNALQAIPANIIEEKVTELAKVSETLVSKQTLFNQANELLNNHLRNKPAIGDEDTTDTLSASIETIAQRMNELGEERGAINQALKENEEKKRQLGELEAEADRKKAEYNKWNRLNQLIGDSDGKKFRKIAQSYVLASLIHSANNYMKTLSDRYVLKVNPGSFVISLEDAYQGFASRAASTISGGESFLVSLSLALALSDIGQNLSADTLFIDEGFGTLSGEPLQKAIETLRSLHTKAGRHVGIISHVEELQERIPVQIQVIQEGNNSSSKVIVTQ